jgi:hypothetical protein
MDKLKKKILNYRKLESEFSVYFDKFSETVGRYYEDEVKECRSTLASYKEEIDSLTKIPKAMSPKDIFKLVHTMTHLDSIINRTQTHFEYFNPGNHRFTNDVSTTYLSETTTMFDSVILLICQLRKKNKLYDSDIIIYMGAQIMSAFDLGAPMEFFGKLQSYYHKYTSAVNLYAYVIQSVLDRLFAESHEYKIHAYAILNELEKDKTHALSENLYSPEFNGITHNPSLVSFGLIPLTDILSLRDVIYKVFDRNIPEEELVTDATLRDLCAESNVGVIIYRKLTRRPISYNVRGLIERSKKSSDSGIDIALVDKLKTIETLRASHYDFQITQHGCESEQHQTVLILDELAESQYKIMAPWDTMSYLIPMHSVSDFIEFSKKGFIDKPIRMEQYNKLMTKKMLGNMFLDKRVNVVQISEKSQVEEVKYLRNELYLRMLDHYNKIIDTYDGGKSIKTNKDLINIINDPGIKDIFTESLIKNYYAFLKKNEYINAGAAKEFMFNEVIATFLAQLNVINRGFVREIFSHSESHMPDASIYSKPFEAMCVDIKDVIDKVLKDSLAKVLSEKTNIYQSFIFKTMLLQAPMA